MKKPTISLLIVLFPLLLFSQKEQIDCANIFDELESIYIKSIEKGTISPALYAAYKGYQSEWFQQESSLLFTNYNQVSSDLTDMDIQHVNDERIKLGIPILPATLWNTKLF